MPGKQPGTSDAGQPVKHDNDVEKNGDSPKKKSPNQSAESKTCFRKLLEAPCGESPKVVSFVTIIVGSLLMWALLFAVLKQEVEPEGQLFQLLALTVASYFCGWLVSLLYIPPLLGMLICGIALRNIGFYNVSGVYVDVVSTIREMALTLNLLKAGLDLDATALKKLSFVVAALAFTPCFAETLGAAVAAYFLLGMPWLWGLLLGTVLSAVSPSIVVPMLQGLKAKGYGETKGISTLVIAASSIDDILAISAFGVILGIIFAQGDLMHNILQGPIEVALGIVVGISGGILAACIPHRNENYLVAKRSFIVGGGGLVAILLSAMYGYSGSGPLAAIILSFIAQLGWKWQGWSNTYNPVAEIMDHLWDIIEPVLFGLIGTEINIDEIEPKVLGLGIGVLGFSLFTRIIGCCIALIGAKLNWKEVLFVNLAWLPKATVQATLGPVALDMVIRLGTTDIEPYARDLLTVTVLSILITAPAGALGISVGGPLLLCKDSVAKENHRTGNQNVDVAVVEELQ